MERTTKIAVGLSCAAFLQAAAAGTMGEVADASFGGRGITPFVSLEGFPVWISFGGISVTNNASTSASDKGNMLSGGGRFAAGFATPYSPNIDFTAESAWNYFGSTSGKTAGNTLAASLSGVDFLVGALYKYSNYQFFVKGGALFERLDYKINVPNRYVATIESITYYAGVAVKGSISPVLPEIKVGMNYDITPNWAASLAYMHAFGYAPSVVTGVQSTPTSFNDYVSANLRGATLNAINIGVRYQFLS